MQISTISHETVEVTAAAALFLFSAFKQKLGHNPRTVRLCEEKIAGNQTHRLWKPCECINPDCDTVVYDNNGFRIVCNFDNYPDLYGTVVDIDGRQLVFKKA